MKTAIILSALAMISLLGIGDASNDTGLPITDMFKLTVTTIFNDLALYQDRVISNYASDHEKFEKFRLNDVDSMTSARFTVDPDWVRKFTNAKSVDNCVKGANKGAGYLLKYADMEKCDERRRMYLNTTAKKIEKIKNIGNNIIREVDDVIGNCRLSNSVKLLTCVYPKIKRLSASVQKFSDDAEEFKKSDGSTPRARENCIYNFLSALNDQEIATKSILFSCVDLQAYLAVFP